MGRTIRIAQRIEDQRESRNLAQITYAIWFKDAGRKRPTWKRYLKKAGLDQEPEALFLGRLEDDEKRKKVGPTVKRAQTPDEKIEAQLNANEWGDLTVTDLIAYKARKAEKEKQDTDQ